MRGTSAHVWPVKRLRFLTQQGLSNKRRKILSGTTQVTFLPMENIGEQGAINCSLIRNIDDVRNGYTRFFDGDVLVAKIAPCFENGKGALVQGTLSGVGFGTTELHVLAPTDEIDPRFMYYVTASHSFRERGEAAMFGVAGQKRVPEDFVRDYRIPVPPYAKQRAIADYLDRETARLDALVAAKVRLLELLAEKRQACIIYAITKGIKPSVPLRISGVPWPVEIPAHWKIGKLKNFGSFLSGTGFPHEFQGVEGELLPFYKVSDLATAKDNRRMEQSPNTVSHETAARLRAHVVPEGAVVWAKIGAALFLNRRRVTTVPCVIDNNMTAYVPSNKTLASGWAFYWTSILDFGIFANPGAVPSLSEGDQAQLPIAIPPIAEQHAIIDHLDGETARLDALAVKTRETIALLKERRAALIAAAVTGQIAVEGAT